MPVFGDAGNPDAYYGFVDLEYENQNDEIVVDVIEETITDDVSDFSSYAMIWSAVIRMEDFDLQRIKFYGLGNSRANWGLYCVQSQSVRQPFQYQEFRVQDTGYRKCWNWNPSFYSGNRNFPSEGAYGALLSGDFPLDLGVNTKPAAAFSSIASPGDKLLISAANGVFTLQVLIRYYIWGTTLFPGATAPVTFIDI